MSKLFSSVNVLGDGSVDAIIPGKGWRKLISINSIPMERVVALAKEKTPATWSEDLNEMLPEVMAATDFPLHGRVAVEVMDTSKNTTTVNIKFTTAEQRAEVLAALQKNFEGIIALAKSVGLNNLDLTTFFSRSLSELESNEHGAEELGGHPDIPGAGVDGMAGMHQAMNMMQHMVGAAQGGKGGNPNGPECQQQ